MENNSDFTLVNTLYQKISDAFSDPKNVQYLMNAIRSYADKHANILLTSDMSQRLIFSDADKKVIYIATGISEQEVKAAIAKAPLIKNTWKKATNPFYMLSLLIIHYFFKKGKKDDLLNGDAVIVYVGYLLYTTNHKASFMYLPNKQIMDYTLNNLNNRFLIKQMGIIQSVIEHTVTTAIHERFSTEIVRASDDDLNCIISSLDTRVSSFIINVADEFYKNHKNGNYLFHEDEDLSEDNFHLSDNRSFKIDRVVQNVSSSIISSGFDQNTCIKRAIALNPGTSEKKLDAMLRTIIEDDMSSIPLMVSNILTLFMYKGTGNTIDQVKTMKFISESLQIYKSNAQDNVTSHIKEILLKWINMTAEKYGRNFISRGKTSLDTYRKAIYTSFVFKIFESSK